MTIDHRSAQSISVASVGYRSAFIGAVLSTIPGAIVTAAPRPIRLRTDVG